MSHLWPRRVYGKLVVSPGGPIQGGDHTTTARSKQPPFPEVGKAIDSQALGITNQEQWSTYPRAWTEGALLLRPFTASDGVTHVIASRIRSYLEDPEKPTGRSFLETVHATQPAATIDFATLLQIPQRLVTEPLTRVDPDYPPLVLEEPGRVALPPGWFAEARAMLTALVDGEPLVVVDNASSPNVFFTRSLAAAACLPGAIRWRVTIAAGVYSLPALDKGPVQYLLCLPFLSRGVTTPASDSAGASYARWFAEATEDGQRCQTFQDVLSLVDSKFPDWVAWDAVPADLDCAGAARPLGELRDIERIRNWCARPDGKPPGLSHIRSLRPEVMEIAAKALDGSAEVCEGLLEALLEPDWKPAWSAFASRDGAGSRRLAAVGALLAMIEPLDPVGLSAELNRSPLELSSNLDSLILPRLSSQLEASQDASTLERWEGLLRRAFATRTPAWFARWVEANKDTLLWRAVRLRFLSPHIEVSTSWNPIEFPGAPGAVQALLQGRQPLQADFQGLLSQVQRADRLAVLKLVEHVEESAPKAALLLAIEAKLDDWLNRSLQPQRVAALDDDGFRALVAVALERPQLDSRFASALLPSYDRLSVSERQALRDRARSILGPLDSILFGDGSELSRAPIASWLWPIAQKLCDGDSRRRRNVLAAACNTPELVTLEFEEFLLGPILASADLAAVAPSCCASLKFALALREGKCAEFASVRGEDLKAARLWQPILAPRGRAILKAPTLRRLDQLQIALCYGRSLEPFPPVVAPTFWSEWLAIIGSQERRGYLELIEQVGLHSAPFWRFAAGWEKIKRLKVEEIRCIEEHGLYEAYFRAVLQGAPLEFDLSRGLKWLNISQFFRSPDECRMFLTKCGEIEYGVAALDLWKHCLRQMTAADFNALQCSIDRGLLGRILDVLKSRLFLRPEESEGWAQLALEIYTTGDKGLRDKLHDEIERFASS